MALIAQKFLNACRNCTYDANIKCLVNSAGRNVWAAGISDYWETTDGFQGMGFTAFAAGKLIASDTLAVGNDSFSTAGTIYSLIVDPASGEVNAIEAS